MEQTALSVHSQADSVHGPERLFEKGSALIEAHAQRNGVRLVIEYDFAELAEIWTEIQKTGNGLTPSFDTRCGYGGRDGYWISARNKRNDIVATIVGRVFDWSQSDLATELRSFRFFYGDHVQHFKKPSERCVVTARFAASLSGKVLFGGGAWVRPDFRGAGLTLLLPRLSKIYAYLRWRVDFFITVIQPILIHKGVASRYGFRNFESKVHFLMEFGDYNCALGWLQSQEFLDDLHRFVELAGELPHEN
jgi:hypothetical protein